MNNNRILIVDDDPVISDILVALLSEEFDVHTVGSGEECLRTISEYRPDLIVLDIEMPGISGYETCRELVAKSFTIPVIFLSGHDTLEERLEAFDSGGEDFISKLVPPEIILRKVRSAIKAKSSRDTLANEKNSYEQMTMTFLDSMGDTGVILNYTRENLDCPDYAGLLKNTFNSARALGLDCRIQIRFPGGSLSASATGSLSPLEESILMQVSTMGRLFQFKKRLITNFDHISILILNMPDNSDVAGRVRDNIAILAQIADAFVKSITLRKDAVVNSERMTRANQGAGSALAILREKSRVQQVDARVMLDELIREVEKTYVHLSLTIAQENMLSSVLHKNADKILTLFEHGAELEQQFAWILEALSTKD